MPSGLVLKTILLWESHTNAVLMADTETKIRTVTSLPKEVTSSEMSVFSFFIGSVLAILLVPLLPFIVLIYLFDKLTGN